MVLSKFFKTRNDDGAEYAPLAANVDEGEGEGEVGESSSSSGSSSMEKFHIVEPTTKQSRASGRRRLIPTEYYPLVICLLSLLVNIGLFTFYGIPKDTTLSMYDLQKPINKELRRPSQFPGLDKIKRPVPVEHREIYNFPNVVGRLDKMEAGKVITGGRESKKYVNGLPAMKIEASDRISTLLQFRMIDFGMEQCTLHLRLPAPTSTSTTSDLNILEIYPLLNPPSKIKSIDPTTLTYKSVMKAMKKQQQQQRPLVSLNANNEIDWKSEPFDCPMDSLQTFVLVGGSKTTSVSWWQDKQVDIPAIFIKQHATV